MTKIRTLKALENLVSLNNKVTVFVPSTLDVNKAIDNTYYVEKTATFLATLFGGSTSMKVYGYWNGESGLVGEETTLVYSNCTDEQLESGIDEVVDYCKSLKAEMKQEAVALEVNGSLYFV